MVKPYRLILIALLFLLAGCVVVMTPGPEGSASRSPLGSPPPSPPPLEEGQVLISEFLPGVPGNNNVEFVELYNTGTADLDLSGWSLWYRLADNQEEQRIHTWTSGSTIPGLGHYLLARAGEDPGVLPDDEFDAALLDKKGGLLLRDADGEVVDRLGWGIAPEGYVEGAAAPPIPAGSSLERLPGGEGGNGTDSGDNAGDFVLNPEPHPQNTGSALTPALAANLLFDVALPSSVKPGDTLNCRLILTNATGYALENVYVSVPVPEGFVVDEATLAPDMLLSEGRLAWVIAELEPGVEEEIVLGLEAPLLYATVNLKGAYAEAENWPLRAFGPLQRVVIEGGSIPVGVARSLFNKRVIVEGIATMYTGGFFAGSTGTKFYVEDESGGIQVYCPGGKDEVEVQIGERVRVTGQIDLYRGAVEIIPESYPEDVEIFDDDPVVVKPQPVALADFGQDEALLGRLAAVEGAATRIQEFNYSYEVDLTDEEGNTLLVYLEKETGASVEPLELGKQYRVTGIVELYMDTWQLKPRLQEDFTEVFPPELTLSLAGTNSVEQGGLVTYTLTVANYTEAPLTNVFVSASVPPSGASVNDVLDGGVLEGAEVTWTLSGLAPEERLELRYVARASKDAEGSIVSAGAVATAVEWPEAVVTPPAITFIGRSVPIWAVQGAGMDSPYVRDEVAVAGLVTGIFPKLGGFWVQSLEPDRDPLTSEGLFVLVEDGDLGAGVALGDEVLLRGRVRERSGQTLLDLQEPPEIESRNNALPAAVELDPPEDAAESVFYYEALEGMLVQVSVPATAVAPTSKYGEYVLVREEREIERVLRGDPTGMLIFVDDGSEESHADRSTLPYVVRTGDTVLSVMGPLAFTYEKYKIEPILRPTIITHTTALPRLPEVGANSFSVATFNVENLFDTRLPHPSDPPRPTREAYELDVTKTADAILAMGLPTIVGLQEVENVDVLEDLVEQAALVAAGYVPVLVEGSDSRGIDVGYLVRGDRATVEGSEALPAPQGLTSRPPLLITVTVELESGPQRIYLLNNHFTSMAAGEEATEPRRMAQAAWNVILVEEILQQDPEALVVVLGDLNSFYASKPLDILREGGLRHVYEKVAPELPYTYIFQGVSETLDHILVTPALYRRLTEVTALHINADFPPPLPGDASARRVSDHDPLIAVFTFDGR